MSDTLRFAHKGALVTLDTDTIIKLWLGQASKDTLRYTLPKIGQHTQDGIFVGICADSVQDNLIFLAEEQKEDINWKDAIDWATCLTEGRVQDWSLPTRGEQALLFANVPQLFKPTWYWSKEPCSAESASYAWSQGFGTGLQNYDDHASVLRARAVRRVPIGDQS